MFTLGGGLLVSGLLRSECVPRPMTSHGLPGWWYPHLSVHGGGGRSGEGLGMPPRPRVNRRFRTFFARPAPFLLLPSWRRVPARHPLPAPRQAEPAPPQEVGAGGGHAESEAESPATALSLVWGPMRLRLPRLEPPGAAIPGDQGGLAPVLGPSHGKGASGTRLVLDTHPRHPQGVPRELIP